MYENPKLKLSDNGRYIVCYGKYAISKDGYEGRRYLGEGEEVFEDRDEAMDRLEEIHGIDMKMDKAMMDKTKKSVKKS